MHQIAAYWSQYYPIILLGLVYFIACGFVGLFLILRRAALYGLVLAQTAQVAFLIGLFCATGVSSHEHTYAMINRAAAGTGEWHFLEIDAFVLPLTLLLSGAFVIPAARGKTGGQGVLLVLSLLLFQAALPLINKISGGSDTILLKAYFTEILYTPPAMFLNYLPWTIVIIGAIFLLRRQVLLSAFDPVQAKLVGINPHFYNLLYYFLTGLLLSFAVRILGTYVAMAALLVPGYIALSTCRRLPQVFLMATSLAVLLPLAGFFVAFAWDHLPTEPLLATQAILMGMLVVISYRTFVRPRAGC
ncbi:MAG: metal ABC transporter permease [Turneriella sp.]|nr:metal ABC transporter permease [Turneriella sp.]